MTDPLSLDDVELGMASAFWRDFSAHAKAEWGPGGRRYVQAVEAAAMKADDGAALHTLRMTIFAAKEIELLFRWPEEQAAKLKGQKAASLRRTPSRRGPGL